MTVLEYCKNAEAPIRPWTSMNFTDFIDFIDGIFLEYREDSIDTPDIQLNIKMWPFYATQQCVYITRTEFFS